MNKQEKGKIHTHTHTIWVRKENKKVSSGKQMMKERKSSALCHSGRSAVTRCPVASYPGCQLQAHLSYFFLLFLILEIVQNISDVRIVVMKQASKLHGFPLIVMLRRQWRFIIIYHSTIILLLQTVYFYHRKAHFVERLHELMCWFH